MVRGLGGFARCGSFCGDVCAGPPEAPTGAWSTRGRRYTLSWEQKSFVWLDVVPSVLPEGTDPHTVNSTRTKVCSGNRELIASRWLERGKGTEHKFAIAAGGRSSIGHNGPP